MTDKTPAMLEHSIAIKQLTMAANQFDCAASTTNDPKKAAEYAQEARDIRASIAALQSAQPAAAVSDEELQAIDDAHNWQTTAGRHAAYRAILALRPQAVPMTEDKFVACLVKANCIGVVKMSYDSGPYYVTRPSINASKLKEAVEAHHGITAQGAQEGK